MFFMSLIDYNVLLKNMAPTTSCPQKVTLYTLKTKRKDKDKTSLKFYQRDGQISSPGQLADRNSFFPVRLLVSMKGSPFVCQTCAFILYRNFLYKHMDTHTQPFKHEQVTFLPFLFLSFHCTPVCPNPRNSTYIHAGARTVSVKSSHELPSFDPLSAPAIGLTDVIVSSRGGLSLIEVYVRGRVGVCIAICPEHRLAVTAIVWPIRQAVKCSLPAALCSCYNNGNVSLKVKEAWSPNWHVSARALSPNNWPEH